MFLFLSVWFCMRSMYEYMSVFFFFFLLLLYSNSIVTVDCLFPMQLMIIAVKGLLFFVSMEHVNDQQCLHE